MADKTGKTLIQFNVKNGSYSTDNTTVKPLTWLNSVSKEKDVTTKKIFGDGELVITLINDKGFTGTLSLTARDQEFELDNGMLKEIDGGYAEIEQLKVLNNSVYFEVEFAGDDGVRKNKKVWMFGVEVSPASDTYNQTTDDINESTADYPIVIKGVNLKDNTGTTDYKDPETGQTIKVFTSSKVPGDTGYDTFGDSVPVPKATV